MSRECRVRCNNSGGAAAGSLAGVRRERPGRPGDAASSPSDRNTKRAASSASGWAAGTATCGPTPVRLPMLDLQKEAGGLKPVRQVGQNQSVGLAMAGADGRSYTFRSLHKEADRMLPAELRGTVVGEVLRDLTSGTHPAAGVILPTLAEAAGVPHTTPRMVVMPDDPALGEFRKTFANLIGTIEEFPQPARGATPGFMGATEIISSTQMWTKWMEGPENSFDRLAYLRARVLDLWVDNYDRHRGQWRWMRLPGKAEWQPLPEDPDFVLIHRDGQVARSVRSQVPQYLKFSEKFPGRIDGALLNSAEMDRWILAGATAADFESIARDLQARFTDQVIDSALRQMPPEWYALRGARARGGAAHAPRRAGGLPAARLPLLRAGGRYPRHRSQRAGRNRPSPGRRGGGHRGARRSARRAVLPSPLAGGGDR